MMALVSPLNNAEARIDSLEFLDHADRHPQQVTLMPQKQEESLEPLFLSPHEFINRRNLELRYCMLRMTLSRAHVPFPRSTGLVKASLLAEPMVRVWQGSQAEARRRRPEQEVRQESDEEAERAGDSDPERDIDEVEAWLNGVEDVELASSSSRSSSKTSSSSTSSGSGGRPQNSARSSTSSSSCSSSSAASTRVASPEQRLPVRGEAPPVAEAEVHPIRMHRDATFDWGPFKFTWREPNGYQALCRFHNRGCRNKCTKTATWRTGDEREIVVKALKLWCLDATTTHDKLTHQGSRGLPQYTAEQLAVSEEELQARLAALPELPDD